MSDYSRQAANHWRECLPERYAQIPDPTTFFDAVGARAQQQVEELATQLAGPDTPGEDYLAKVGRLTNARGRAEEIVLPQEVLLAPERLSSYDPQTDLDVLDPETEPESQPGEMSSGWIPTQVDPTHPYWQDHLQRETDHSTR